MHNLINLNAEKFFTQHVLAMRAKAEETGKLIWEHGPGFPRLEDASPKLQLKGIKYPIVISSVVVVDNSGYAPLRLDFIMQDADKNTWMLDINSHVSNHPALLDRSERLEWDEEV
jgi:hypothetical protein